MKGFKMFFNVLTFFFALWCSFHFWWTDGLLRTWFEFVTGYALLLSSFPSMVSRS